MFGKVIKGLFGSSSASEPKTKALPPVLYDGFEIIAEPRPSGGQWQVAGQIEKDIDGERKVHVFVRADTMPTSDEAAEHTIRKAKLLIDQQGPALFD
ncbi:HlyU family transcriptional regulator [Labrenzia sp. CE80]|uniref:HlyU family transcriptional regulator n=1 Tax=Labrenzia sp. CE80 TaxID=1788986 RepID=UPI00129AB6D9|nr:HlyU family transcriptional regulator [Labrenzia sp. CE80]